MDSAKCRKQVPAAVWDVQIGGLSLPSPPLLPLPSPCDRVGISRDPFAITSDRAAAPPLSVAMGAGSQSYCSAGVGGAAGGALRPETAAVSGPGGRRRVRR